MTASNLGMVFGPTLMRPEQADQEPFDIEHQKIIIEMIISEMETVNVCVCVCVCVGPQTVPVTFQSSFFRGLFSCIFD